MFLKILFLGLSFLLISCQSCLPPKEVVASCRLQCEKRAEQCVQLCKNSCPRCREKVFKETVENYQTYVRQTVLQGQTVARELKSYASPLTCRKVSCHCAADYHVCLQSCTGVIVKQLRAPSSCQAYCP